MTGSATYNGTRLKTLRALLGLTQGELGRRLGLAQAQLSRIERGYAGLTEEVAHSASEAFAQPLSFFQVPESPIPLGPVAFRSTSELSAARRNQVRELHAEAARTFYETSLRSQYRVFNATTFAPPSRDAEEAARAVRQHLGLGDDAPVKNLVRTLELLGIGVVVDLADPFDDDTSPSQRAQVSGISAPTIRNDRPLVATLSIGRGDVQRLTIGHELGHLILHHDAPTISCSSRQPQEREAFAFAAHFLVPRIAMQNRITEQSMLSDFLALKMEYGISASAGVMHAHRLGLISDERNKSLRLQISARKWKYEEPVDVSPETPRLFGQALARIFPTATYARASHDLGLGLEQLERWAPLPSRPVKSSISSHASTQRNASHRPTANITDIFTHRSSRR